MVDDSFHLHVFCARGLNGISGFPSSLFHLKFDSWGNLLSGPTELLPGNHYVDYSPGVLLDRNGVIHLLWSRSSDWPVPPQVIYARLNTNGEFLTPPTVTNTTGCVQKGMNLVQNINGDVWAVGESQMAAFHENGEMFVPFQPIFPPESNSQAMSACASVSPDGHIYAAVRYFSPGDTQCIAVTRLDTSVREATIILPGTSPTDPVDMGVAAFFIDTTGTWHSKLGRDYWGLFYQRNLPDGSMTDTLSIDPYGTAGTYFELVGGDTLVTLSDHIGPPFRCGIKLDGTWAYRPIEMAVPDWFLLGELYHFAWKEGSYWILGLRFRPNDAHSIAMIHVPGPNEPPNAVDDRTPRSEICTFILSPNPTTGPLFIHGPLEHVQEVAVFNILGQRVWLVEPQPGSAPFILPNLSTLPAGPYFVNVRTANETFVQKIILQR
ncbi:MAG: T9SS type A sorting domain-containing protein [bacterium]|nr:T9SS type A sorting domain-containing protein [bacterium]